MPEASAGPAPGASEAPELAIVADMVRRAAPWVPLALLGGLVWGVAGVTSVAYGLAVVVANLALSAWILATCARIGPAALMAGALGGFLVRLGLVFIAVLVVIGAGWIEPLPLALTVVVTHLGLLAWEVRHVSASLAFPGVAPARRPKEIRR